MSLDRPAWHDADKKEWVLVLNEYQRNNLLWLINACGYPYADRHGVPVGSVEPFTLANTGDWLGEVAIMLQRSGEDPILAPGDRPNCGLEELRGRVEGWRDVSKVDRFGELVSRSLALVPTLTDESKRELAHLQARLIELDASMTEDERAAANSRFGTWETT